MCQAILYGRKSSKNRKSSQKTHNFEDFDKIPINRSVSIRSEIIILDFLQVTAASKTVEISQNNIIASPEQAQTN